MRLQVRVEYSTPEDKLSGRSFQEDRSMTRTTIGFSAFAVAFLVAVPASFGDTPGRHPVYLHARSDLRRAEHLMDWTEFRNVRHDLDQSSRHIREAIREIGRASCRERV